MTSAMPKGDWDYVLSQYRPEPKVVLLDHSGNHRVFATRADGSKLETDQHSTGSPFRACERDAHGEVMRFWFNAGTERTPRMRPGAVTAYNRAYQEPPTPPEYPAKPARPPHPTGLVMPKFDPSDPDDLSDPDPDDLSDPDDPPSGADAP